MSATSQRRMFALCVVALFLGALPTAAGAAAVRVTRCPTSFGLPETNKRLPRTAVARVSAAQARGLEFFGNNELLVLAPAGWRCSALIGADGSAGMRVARGHQAIAVQAVPYDSSVGAGEACSLFAVAFPPARCPTRPPRRERDTRLSRTAVAFEDPPGVRGTGTSSGGALPANGVMLFDPSRHGYFYEETCLLPAAQHSLCTLLLNDAIRRAPR